MTDERTDIVMDYTGETERLSDGSLVYNVICGNGNGDQFKFRCIDKDSAFKLIKVMDFSVVSLDSI